MAIARAALAAPELVAGPPEQPTRSRQAAAVSAAAAGAAARGRFARETAGNSGADMPIGRLRGTHGSGMPVTGIPNCVAQPLIRSCAAVPLKSTMPRPSGSGRWVAPTLSRTPLAVHDAVVQWPSR